MPVGRHSIFVSPRISCKVDLWNWLRRGGAETGSRRVGRHAEAMLTPGSLSSRRLCEIKASCLNDGDHLRASEAGRRGRIVRDTAMCSQSRRFGCPLKSKARIGPEDFFSV